MRRLIVDTPVQEAALVLDLPEGDLEMTLGRHSESNIVLSGAGISRHHARLVQANGMLFIEDVGSSGGTYVNGERIEAMTPLEENDIVAIGDNTLRIQDVASEGDATADIPAEPASPEPIAETPAPQPPPPPPAPVAPPSPEVNNFLDEFKNATLLYEDAIMELTKQIHTDILERLNLTQGTLDVKNDETMDRVSHVMDQILRERRHEIPSRIPLDTFRQALMDELIGYGPISPVLRSSRVSEIMINGPDHVFVESKGKIFESGIRFFSEQHLLSIIQRIVEPLGRHVDEASPMVDARLPDGSRVNAIIPPLALQGASVTIRKFSEKKLTTDDLIKFGSMTPEMALFLEEAVRSRQNILVSGGTGSGKTTLLNVLSLFIPKGERVITVEDSAELKLDHPNLVSLEARPANIEGKGRITIRDLVINTLRMRPDRIIVGECRGAEALDMLTAMNTGHDGSLTTLHANSPEESISRLTTMVRYVADLPVDVIEANIASAIDLVVQTQRSLDGHRSVTDVVAFDFDRLKGRCLARSLYARDAGNDEGRWVEVPDWVDRLVNSGIAEEEEVAEWKRTYLSVA